MKKLADIKKIYFIGIGGIGMSALARFFHAKGVSVSGYDKTVTPLTRELESSGIAIHYEENLELAPKNADAVVYTPAIPARHAELVYYIEHQYTVVKRSDVLQWITASSFNICVAGTHGKTTVTSMIAHLLRHSGYGCNAFLGGIAANYNTNFWSHERNVVVVEADEYDRSFLKLVPDIAIITSMDPDHLDIYGTPVEVENAFIQFSQKIKKDGCLVFKYGLTRTGELAGTNRFSYDFENENAAVYASNRRVEEGNYVFDVVNSNWTIKDVVLTMGGLHNIENSIAAIAVGKYLGITEDKIKAAIADFKGVRRRFEYALKNRHHILIDDYAHHPEELRALISGVRSIFGKQKLVLVFQPHLFSRTKDLVDEFAASLDLADEVILLPIYPARELPVEGVTSDWLMSKMTIKEKKVLSKEAMVSLLEKERPALIVMAGAGDIDAQVKNVKAILEKK
ncbi:MAG: hypothetical protein RLZZ28_1418 [Bacteroidota bacterium]